MLVVGDQADGVTTVLELREIVRERGTLALVPVPRLEEPAPHLGRDPDVRVSLVHDPDDEPVLPPELTLLVGPEARVADDQGAREIAGALGHEAAHGRSPWGTTTDPRRTSRGPLRARVRRGSGGGASGMTAPT